LHLPWKTWVALKCFTVLKSFYHSVFLSNLRFSWKQDLHWIHCIENIILIIQDFWAHCACPKNRVSPEYTVLNIYFSSLRIFEKLALTRKNTSCHDIFHCIEYIFLSFKIFEQLALPLKKHEVPWYPSLYWNIFIIQYFWATCAFPENRVCPEFTELNIYFLSLRIFEQLALALRTGFALKFFKPEGAAVSSRHRLVRLRSYSCSSTKQILALQPAVWGNLQPGLPSLCNDSSLHKKHFWGQSIENISDKSAD